MITVSSLQLKKFLNSINQYIEDNGVKSNVNKFSSLSNSSYESISWTNKNTLNFNKIKSKIIIAPKNFIDKNLKKEITVFKVFNPKLSFFKITDKFFLCDTKDFRVSLKSFIHPSAIIKNNVRIDHGVVIEKNCIIKENSIVSSNSYLENTEIGRNCIVGVNCTLGKEGAGFIFDENMKEYFKVSHVGKIKIKDKVEIQSNCFISKGTLDDTIINNGTKIGPSCTLAHNVIIGKNCLLTGSNTIGGSSIVGNNVYMGLGSIISNKINIGHKAFISLGTVVVNEVKNKEKVTGNFAVEHNKFLYNYYKNFKSIK